MPKNMLCVCSIFFLFAACSRVHQSPQPKINPGSDILLPRISPQAPGPSLAPGPAPTWTATLSPSPTRTIRLLATITPSATDSPFLNVDPRGQRIEFWHVWGNSSAGEVLTEIINQFNASNDWGIEVVSVAKDGHGDVEFDFYRALATSDEPNVIIAYSNVLASFWYQEILEDVNSYFHDPQYGLPADVKADFYPQALKAGDFDHARVGFPFSQSGNVIFYNRTWAIELGFQTPPHNTAEFIDQACAASRANNHDADPSNDGTGGLVLYPGTANILSWIYAFEGEIFTPETQQYAFDSPPVQEVAIFLQELNRRGCAYQTEGYPNPEFATRKALFTTSSSVGCQYQEKEFEKQGSMRDEWQLIAFPGKSGEQAIVIFPQMLGLVDRSPEQNLASWLFMKYLTSPEVQAKWSRGSQYYPVRMSAIAGLSDFAAIHPQWASGVDLIDIGRAEPTHHSWKLVRQYTQATFMNLLENKAEDNHGFLADLDLAAVEAVAETIE